MVLSKPHKAYCIKAPSIFICGNCIWIKADYSELLAVQPARARQWVVFFEPGTQTLTPASLPALAALKAALADMAAGEVIVTGHTDRVGNLTDNDRLSLARAQAVRCSGLARTFQQVLTAAVEQSQQQQQHGTGGDAYQRFSSSGIPPLHRQEGHGNAAAAAAAAGAASSSFLQPDSLGDPDATEFLSRILLLLGSFVILCLLLF